MLGLHMKLESWNPNPFCTWLERAQGCFAVLWVQCFPEKEWAIGCRTQCSQSANRFLQAPSPAVCGWGGIVAWDCRGQAARDTAWRWGPSHWGAAGALAYWLSLRKKTFYQSWLWWNVGVPLFSRTAAEPGSAAEKCPQVTAVHRSQTEGAVRGFSHSVPWLGQGDCKDSPGWPWLQSVLWLGPGGVINASHSVVNPALPAAKLCSACEGRGTKSLRNLPFPQHTELSVQRSLALLPSPNFPLQRSVAFGENPSLCLCV